MSVPLAHHRALRRRVGLALAAWLAACWLPAAAQTPPPTVPLPTVHPASVAVGLEVVRDDLTLPVSLTPLDDGSGRSLLVQLDGVVLVLDTLDAPPRPFLDLRHRVTGLAGEQGLFTVALEPPGQAAARGHRRHVVAAFTERGTGDLIVAGYPVDDAFLVAAAATETVLLRVPMPEPFHHGGQVAFGPDGMLYVSVGNGESSNSFLHVTPASAQDLRSLRGKLLRIDAFPASGAPYDVPDDNPFTAEATRDPSVRGEIWALGFRNPWKFHFDAASGALYLADVGNDRWEEIDVVVPGGNYGWPAREGPECQAFPDAAGWVDPSCEERAFEAPRVAFAHLTLDLGGGQAVVGGVVARDPEMPALDGRYLFGDYVTGRLWSLDPVTDRVERLLDTGLSLTAIVEGPDHEVLLLGVQQGVLARLVTLP